MDTGSYNPWPGFRFTGPLRPWPITTFRTVPKNIPYPDYAVHPDNISILEEKHPSKKIIVLTEEEIIKMRKVSREVLDEAAKVVAVGVTTEYIDEVVHEFPKSVCSSINEVVCHGIPDSRPLQDGDILNLDVTLYHDGFHGDLNETFIVGQVDANAIHLIETTYQCLTESIKIVKPGTPYKEIGTLIEDIATKSGYSVVRNYVGHGVNRLFHCPPTVYHRRNNYPGVMKQGHTFTIEPMINEGTAGVIEWPDKWTVVTKDGKRSAQFEQTLLVTETGCEVLTARPNAVDRPYFIDQLHSKDSP